MKLKQSLAYQLLKVTFSAYVLITVSITVMHMYTVWIQAETFLHADLLELGNSAQQGIVLALWDLDYVQVDLIVEGLLDLPVVVGIEVKDRKIDKLYGTRGDIKKRYHLIHEEEQDVTYDIGDMTMYSSRSIVFNRVKNGYLLTVINAIIKTLALWIIVLLAGKKLITQPLALLTEANKSIDLENVETFKEVHLGIRQSDNELAILEESFNTMVQRLAIDRQELARINQHLELTVEQRTHELQATNDTLKQEITVRKNTEEEFKTAKEQAENANRAKSVFLANMSHELRTPLNVILGFAQVIARNSNIPPEEHDNLGIIQRNGGHLLTLINQVLNLSKIEAGRIPLREKDFDIYQLLDDLNDMFSLKTKKQGLYLVFALADDIPRYIRTDEVKLRQVFINVLNNALKFTTEGGVTLDCRLLIGDWRLRDETHTNQQSTINNQQSNIVTLQFSISDTGPGIVPEEIDTVFEAFAQTETGRQAQEGTGLGLPISRKFVQLMGGDMTVKSEVGKGTTFAFHIQADIVKAEDVKSALPTRRVVALEPGQRSADGAPIEDERWRMLIVDDKPDNRKLLVTLLKPFDVDLFEATNGQEAIDMWEAWEPHLIWMDMRMPVMDGYETTKKIRKLEGKKVGSREDGSAELRLHETKIIAVTASSFEEEQAVVLSVGCDDFLRKPFTDTEVFEMLHKHLGIRFVYEEEAQSSIIDHQSSIEEVLTPESLAALPAEWLETLRQGARRADFILLSSVIEQIRGQDARLADALAQLAGDFEYDKILALLQNTERR